MFNLSVRQKVHKHAGNASRKVRKTVQIRKIYLKIYGQMNINVDNWKTRTFMSITSHSS